MDYWTFRGPWSTPHKVLYSSFHFLFHYYYLPQYIPYNNPNIYAIIVVSIFFSIILTIIIVITYIIDLKVLVGNQKGVEANAGKAEELFFWDVQMVIPIGMGTPI